jgi:hypothetical protein
MIKLLGIGRSQQQDGQMRMVQVQLQLQQEVSKALTLDDANRAGERPLTRASSIPV